MQSSCDLNAVVQPPPQKPQSASHSNDIQPRPPSSEAPPRRRRSGDVRMRSGDAHTRSSPKINKSEPSNRTRSGDARIRSHDQAVVSHDAGKQPKSPLTTSAPSTSQQVHDNSVTQQSLTSHSKSHISQSDCNKQATSTVAASTPAKFNWEEQVGPILSAINSASKADTEVLCELCANLWTTLQLGNTIGRSGKSKQRSSVLRTMFQLLDSKDSRLLLRATKIILAVSDEFV